MIVHHEFKLDGKVFHKTAILNSILRHEKCIEKYDITSDGDNYLINFELRSDDVDFRRDFDFTLLIEEMQYENQDRFNEVRTSLIKAAFLPLQK